MQIPLSKPHVPGQVYENLKQVLSSGKLSGDGKFCHGVEAKLQNLLETPYALLTTSGTHALEMSMLLLHAEIGDEVILPSFTFSSTANAVLMAGLKPIFCEVEPKTMNLDVQDVAKKITTKTRAVIPIHYAGVACDMNALAALCTHKKIAIVEDAAQALGAKYAGQYLGTLGEMGTFSFHDTKNVICGEGGALVTKQSNLAERAQIIREKGTNRAQFLKGQVDKYTWVDKGSSFILAEPLAAILDAELDVMHTLNAKRGAIYNFYLAQLRPLEDKQLLQLPYIPDKCESNYHIFHIILPTADKRNSLMYHLRQQGIGATFHYIPLHSAPAGRSLGYKHGDLPVTEIYSERLLRLPLYPDLTVEEMQFVVDNINSWMQKQN